MQRYGVRSPLLLKVKGVVFTNLKPGSTSVEIFHHFRAIVFVHFQNDVLWSQPKQKTAVFSLLYRCPSGHALRLLISVLTNHLASSVVITLGCLKSFKCSWKVEFRRWIAGVKILAEYYNKFGSYTIWLPTKLFLLFARWPLLARKNLQRISLAKLVTKLRWVFTFLCLCLTYLCDTVGRGLLLCVRESLIWNIVCFSLWTMGRCCGLKLQRWSKLCASSGLLRIVV